MNKKRQVNNKQAKRRTSFNFCIMRTFFLILTTLLTIVVLYLIFTTTPQQGKRYMERKDSILVAEHTQPGLHKQ